LSAETLLIDLGGTNLRAGVGNPQSLKVSDVKKFPIRTNDDFYKALDSINSEARCDEIIISAAGPCENNKISMTNRNLSISGTDVEKRLGASECYLLNDWESIGYSLPLMKDNDLKTIKPGNLDLQNTCLAIGPGTGLGFSVLRYVKNTPYVYATELGNTKSFNAYFSKLFEVDNNLEFLVLEDFLSGSGIKKIFNEKSGENLTPEEVVSSYGNNDLATFVIDKFVVGLGVLLSDLALTFNAKGGIFFAGSIMRTISEMNAINMLKDNFENHHSEAHNEILKNISINLINKEHTPLYGNLNYSVIRRLHE